MSDTPFFKITTDDLSTFESPTFMTFGETMVRDTPADLERPERTRLVHLSMTDPGDGTDPPGSRVYPGSAEGSS